MKNQKGQALLIAVMLLSTAITIVLAVSFKSTTDTKTVKLEEESQKAFAAAEAGLEAAIQQGNGTVALSALNVPSGFTGQATVDSTSVKPAFVTTPMRKDEQYTFYVADYNKTTGAFSSPWTGNLTFYFGVKSADCAATRPPALEVITIATVSGVDKATRRLIEPCSPGAGSDISATRSATGYTVDSTTFSYKADSPITVPAQAKVVIIRSLFADGPIGIDGGGSNLRLQGKSAISEAHSPSGVTKRISLFQSYPQIPSDFFVTSF